MSVHATKSGVAASQSIGNAIMFNVDGTDLPADAESARHSGVGSIVHVTDEDNWSARLQGPTLTLPASLPQACAEYIGLCGTSITSILFYMEDPTLLEVSLGGLQGLMDDPMVEKTSIISGVFGFSLPSIEYAPFTPEKHLFIMHAGLCVTGQTMYRYVQATVPSYLYQ